MLVVELVPRLDVHGPDEDLRQMSVRVFGVLEEHVPQRIRSFERCRDTRRIISNYLQGSGVSRASHGSGKSAVVRPMRSVCSGGETA